MFSGKHDESVMGVLSGNYDAAAVASDVFRRMVVRDQITENDFRIIYRSTRFPTSSFAYAHDLEPALRERIIKCFFDYRLSAEMTTAFDGADRYYPISYQKDWEIVRKIAEAGGESFNRAAYEKESRREYDARAHR
jgi:phosphonate transport system substrate-binding protein